MTEPRIRQAMDDVAARMALTGPPAASAAERPLTVGILVRALSNARVDITLPGAGCGGEDECATVVGVTALVKALEEEAADGC